MKILSKLGFCVALLVPRLASGALTTVADHLYRADGTSCSGSLTVSWPTFTASDGHLVVAGSTPFNVIAGLLSVSIEPNPSSTYTVRYQLQPSGCVPSQEYWLVPTSASPVPLSVVRSLNPPTPPTLIALAWLAQDGATVGQAMCWLGSYWGPGSCGGGGGGGGSSASASLTFGTMVDGQCADNTFSFPGASPGAQVAPGLPSTFNSGLEGIMWISAANTASVRVCNFSGISVTLGALTFSANITPATSGSATIDFSALLDGACASSTFALTGVIPSATLVPGWPSSLNSGILGNMLVPSADTVQVRICNFSGATVDPAPQVFSASIP